MPSPTPTIAPHVPLRELRVAHGLTCEQLAEKIAEHGQQITPSAVSNIELGHKKASALLMTAWARALKISPLNVRQEAELRVLLDGRREGRVA
ncbi:MAG TPA: helix-turn-helix transcriptional regulator [Acidothermaceae bacterium]|jgi:transcriptional regulator with XRE-family HTH domain